MSYTPFVYKTCAICGIQFIKLPRSIYKMDFANRRLNFCSYACYRIAQKTKESINCAEYTKYMKELSPSK